MLGHADRRTRAEGDAQGEGSGEAPELGEQVLPPRVGIGPELT